MGKQRPIDLSGFDEIVKTSKPKELDLSAFDEIVKKKDDLQSVSPIGTQTSKSGSLPFLPQVSTKIPSVLLSDTQKQQREQERIGKRFETTLLNIPTEFGRVAPAMKAAKQIQETLPEAPSFRKIGEIPRMQPTAMTEGQLLGESLTKRTDFQELTTDKFTEKKTALQKQIENAENAFRAYQGDELANQVQSYIPPEETLKIKQELGFDEKMSNVGSNFVNRLERFAPNTALAVGQTLTTLLGEDYGGEAYRMITGGVGNAEFHRMEAFDKLAKLDAEYKYSKGLIQSVQDLDLGGVAAGITDAVGSLVSTIITSAPTAGLGLYSDMVGSGLYNYNSAKANRLGITVDELYDSSQNEFFVPAILGGVGAQLEKIGLKGIKTAIMSNMAKGAGQKFALIGHNMNKEGVTELLQTGLEEVSNTLAQGKSVAEATLEFGKTLFSKKGAESYLMGVVASGSAIGGGRILKGLFSDKSKKKASQAIQAIEQQQQELSNPDLTEESRVFVYENIKNNVAELVDAVDSDVNETDGLSEDQKREVNNLNTKIQAFQVVINDPAASEETKNRAAKVSKETQAKIDAIIKKKPPIVPPATGGAMVEAEPIAKPTFDTEQSLIAEGQKAEAEFKQTDDLVTYEQKMKELDDRANNLVPAPEEVSPVKTIYDKDGNPTEIGGYEVVQEAESVGGERVFMVVDENGNERYLTADGKELLLEKQGGKNAIQIETAGQVPVLTEATVGEEVEQGKPEPEAEVVTEEGVKAEEVGSGVGGDVDVKPATFADAETYGESLVDNEGRYVDNMTDFLSDKIDKKHLYHTSKLDNLEKITDNGVIISKVGLKDGTRLNASFWSDDPTVRTGWTSEKDIVFRVKKNNKFRQSFQSGEKGEYLSETNVLPKDIEYLGADGKWHPLSNPKAVEQSLKETTKAGSVGVGGDVEATAKSLEGENGEYVYHGTKDTFIESIAKDGLKTGTKWATNGRIFLSPDEKLASIYGKILRIKKSAISDLQKSDRSKRVVDLDVYETKKAISPNDIEIKTDNGWQPLTKTVEQSLKETTKAGSVGVGGDVVVPNQLNVNTDRIRKGTANSIEFSKPIIGKNGAKLLSYTWESKDFGKDKFGKPIRFSDWEKAGVNADTGRSIVHKFKVEVDGKVMEVSADSVAKALGFTDAEMDKVLPNAKDFVKQLAKMKMREQALVNELEDTAQTVTNAVKKVSEKYGVKIDVYKEGDNVLDSSIGMPKDDVMIGNDSPSYFVWQELREQGIYFTERQKVGIELNRVRNLIKNKIKQASQFGDLKFSENKSVEQLRAEEQSELKAAIPNADQYLTDGKVDRAKITDAKDLKKFDEIYDKYDKLITPLLPKKEAKAEEVERTEFDNEEDAELYAISKETDPNVIADKYYRLPSLENTDYKGYQLVQAILGKRPYKVSLKEWTEYGGDKSQEDLKKYKRFIKEGKGDIDDVTETLTDRFGVEVTPEDIVGTIIKYGNKSEFNRKGVSNVEQALLERYNDLTGKMNITEAAAKKGFDTVNKKNKASNKLYVQKEALQEAGITEEDIAKEQEFASEGFGELETPLEKFEYQKKQISKKGKTELEIKTEIFAKAKEMAATIRGAKIGGKGKAFDATLGLPVAIWNGAIETVATAIEAGVAVADAIKRGLNYIQKNNRGAWNKKAYNDRVIAELGLRGIEVNGTDLIVQPLEDKATVELVNGFYSPLEKGIAEAKTDKATGKGWMKVLSGVTEADELNYTGVKDFLNSNADRPISRKELLDYMKNNRIEVVEVVKGGEIVKKDEAKLREIESQLESMGFTLELDMGGEGNMLIDKDGEIAEYEGNEDAYSLVETYNELSDGGFNQYSRVGQPDTKFSQYQLEGEKENYKEVLVTLPSRTPLTFEQFKLRAQKETSMDDYEVKAAYKNYITKGDFSKLASNQFKSSHFEQPNILVHLRMNTRTDVDGNKVLFIEEVQSDWGQKGKREGFEDKEKQALADNKQSLINQYNDLDKIRGEKRTPDVVKKMNNILNGINGINKKLGIEENDYRTVPIYGGGTPTAPFVTDTNAWTKLGLKTALKEAVAQGADKLAWTTGEQQNDRYDLSKSVNRVSSRSGKDVKYVEIDAKSGSVSLEVDNNGKVLKSESDESFGQDSFVGTNLSDVIGKEVADKIMSSEKVDLSGEGLKIGGKGMKGFYGSPTEGSLGIVGNVAKTLFKQEPGTVEIESNSSYNSGDVYMKINPNGRDYSIFESKDAGKTASKYLETDINKEDGLKYLKENYGVFNKTKGSQQYSIDITPELKQAVKEGIPLFKNELTQAKEKLKEASAALSKLNKNLGIYSDPEQKAKALFEYHKALVGLAKAYIKEGIKSLEDFANQIGEDVTQEVRDAWREAKGGDKKTLSDFKEDAEKLQAKEEKERLRQEDLELVTPKLEDYESKEPTSTSKDFESLAYQAIESDEFKNTLSNKERESGKTLTRAEKRYQVNPLMAAFELGESIVAKAKEEFGDTYVNDLLAYIAKNQNTLGVDKSSLILLTLENDLNRQQLSDPNNITLAKQERMVQNLAIAYQRSAARAVGYGRLRQIARVGYDVDEVTNQLFSSEQVEGRRKVVKAMESTADEINDEAELQEQETEGELIIEEPKVKRDAKQVRADIKEVIKQMRADLVKSARGAGGALSAIPFAQQVKDVTPHIIKLSKLFAELGGMKTKEIVAKIRKSIKGLAPDVDETVITDILKGEKTTPKKAPKDRLEQTKDAVKARIEELKQEIEDKRKELKVVNKVKSDAELDSLLEQEKELKKIANQYLTQESIDRINESKEKSIVTKLENEIANIDEQIANQQKLPKSSSSPVTSLEITLLKAQRKARIDVLNELDPNPKAFTKQALIDAGYSREITVTRKGGIKEKIQVLDWKKLAGNEMDVNAIKNIVEQALKDKGFTPAQISRMQDAFVKEFTELRASVIDKSLNTLRQMNEPKKVSERKSSARQLAELFDFGLFNQDPDKFNYLLNKILGLSDLDQESFFELNKLSEAIKEINLMNSNEFFTRQFIREINLKITKVLNKVARQQGSTSFKVVSVVAELMNLALRTKLLSLKQFLDNQISGRQERFIQDIGLFGKKAIDTKELKKLRLKYSSVIKSDITKNAGLYFGEVNSPFLTKSQIEDYINSRTDNQIYHALVSIALGKSYLEGADSLNKAASTEKFFISMLLKVLTDNSNPNRMTPEAALQFVNEQLTGQKFADALVESAKIINQINTKAGRVILAETKQNIFRGAMDLVKANLLVGQALDANALESAYNAAYTVAGYGLGHEANNPISWFVNKNQAALEEERKSAIKEKEWGKASVLTIGSTLNRNILNPFVGGGMNWLFLGFQKSGIDPFSPLFYAWKKLKNGIDMSTETGRKKLEETLIDDYRLKTLNRRLIVGGISASLFTLAVFASGGDDEMEEWLKKNEWARRYQSVFVPQLTLIAMAYYQGTLGDWLTETFSKSQKFERLPKIKKAIEAYNKGDSPEADRAKFMGVMGNVTGSFVDVPLLPVKFARDLGGVYRYIVDKPQEKPDFKNVGFANGFFNYGLIDYMGFRPDRTYMRNMEEYIPESDEKTIKFLRKNGLDINSNSDKAVLSNGIKKSLTEAEAQKYDNIWGKEAYRVIKEALADNDDMDETQIKSLKKVAEFTATRKAQSELDVDNSSLQELEMDGVKYSLTESQINKRKALIKEYIRDNRNSEKFKDRYREAIKKGNIVGSAESKYFMLMESAKSSATRKMNDIYENKTSALEVIPK